MEKLQTLMLDISEWSDKTFGHHNRTVAILHHLKKEVVELIDALNNEKVCQIDPAIGVGEYGRGIRKTREEYADCFMLLLDSAHHWGLSAGELLEAVKDKLEINKKREWGNPDKNGVVEHIR